MWTPNENNRYKSRCYLSQHDAIKLENLVASGTLQVVVILAWDLNFPISIGCQRPIEYACSTSENNPSFTAALCRWNVHGLGRVGWFQLGAGRSI